MTNTYLVIENLNRGLEQTWFKNGGLTKGCHEDPIVQLYNDYPLKDYDQLIARLQEEDWSIVDLHPATLFYDASKLVWILYEEDRGTKQEELVVTRLLL